MNDEEDREDGDESIDMQAAANFRQLLRISTRWLHQALLELEELGDEYNMRTLTDFDEDLSDLDLDIF